MAKRDYSDEDGYYTQGFERDGVVSVWIQPKHASIDKDADALQDLCGVGYYRLEDQEANHVGGLATLSELFDGLSYAASFSADVIRKANEMGIETACWLLVQYDFAYDPGHALHPPTNDLVFIGVFPYRHA